MDKWENKSPDWKAEGIEPDEKLKAEGFKAGYKPPAGYFNWFWTGVSRCLEELQNKVGDIIEKRDAYIAKNEEEKAKHFTNKNNPHGVTATQIGVPTLEQYKELSEIVDTKMPSGIWRWIAQGGQPAYIWGANEHNKNFVWKPYNFHVRFAEGAKNSDTVGGKTVVTASIVATPDAAGHIYLCPGAMNDGFSVANGGAFTHHYNFTLTAFRNDNGWFCHMKAPNGSPYVGDMVRLNYIRIY